MKMKIGLQNSSFQGPNLPTSTGYCTQEIDEKICRPNVIFGAIFHKTMATEDENSRWGGVVLEKMFNSKAGLLAVKPQ